MEKLKKRIIFSLGFFSLLLAIDIILIELIDRDILVVSDSYFLLLNLTVSTAMVAYSGALVFTLQFICLRILENDKAKGFTLEKKKFIMCEKSYFVMWSALSLLYFVTANIFNSYIPFARGKNGLFSVLEWSGTLFYAATAFYLCIDDFRFCKDILSYKRDKIIFSKFIRSMLTAITSWLIIIVFIYNNINNSQLPFGFFMLYITISIMIASLYPLLDMYQYTFEELEKHQKELEKIEKEQYKYNHYNYK